MACSGLKRFCVFTREQENGIRVFLTYPSSFTIGKDVCLLAVAEGMVTLTMVHASSLYFWFLPVDMKCGQQRYEQRHFVCFWWDVKYASWALLNVIKVTLFMSFINQSHRLNGRTFDSALLAAFGNQPSTKIFIIFQGLLSMLPVRQTEMISCVSLSRWSRAQLRTELELRSDSRDRLPSVTKPIDNDFPTDSCREQSSVLGEVKLLDQLSR